MYQNDIEYQKKLLLSIKKAQGTLNKITEMVENGVYCVKIAQQVSATIGLLRGANTLLLKHHLQCCGKNKLHSNNKQEVLDFIDELVGAWQATSK
jgi:CsoR family transcriptional regulator, copper-sensing transcriptional repressor